MNRIDRIKAMEAKMDRVQAAVAATDKAIDEYIGALDDIRALAAYYAGETWMKDFAADEAGKLPAELKRGVLSEDGIFDLLEENRALQLKLAETLAKVIRKGSF